MLEITTPEVLERNWGTEQIVVWTPTHAGKILHRKAGTKGGFQLHVKEESHYLIEGQLLLRTKDETGVHERVVEAGSGWTVQPLTVHQEEALTDCVVFEVSDPTRDDRYAIEPDPGGLPSMTDDAALAIAAEIECALLGRAAVYDRMSLLLLSGLSSLVPR